jgi:hypothetical protein
VLDAPCAACPLAPGTTLVEQEPDRVGQHGNQDAATRGWGIGPTVGIKGDALRDIGRVDVGESGGYRH